MTLNVREYPHHHRNNRSSSAPLRDVINLEGIHLLCIPQFYWMSNKKSYDDEAMFV